LDQTIIRGSNIDTFTQMLGQMLVGGFLSGHSAVSGRFHNFELNPSYESVIEAVRVFHKSKCMTELCGNVTILCRPYDRPLETPPVFFNI